MLAALVRVGTIGLLLVPLAAPYRARFPSS
eukprot:COSAG01_NODE_37196_length_507_cov_0.762255_1_plen_29_part_10